MKPKTKTVRISIIGFGYVGAGVVEVIRRKREDIARKYGLDLKIAGIADLSGIFVDEDKPEYVEAYQGLCRRAMAESDPNRTYGKEAPRC